jgi:hypothetical protein
VRALIELIQGKYDVNRRMRKAAVGGPDETAPSTMAQAEFTW